VSVSADTVIKDLIRMMFQIILKFVFQFPYFPPGKSYKKGKRNLKKDSGRGLGFFWNMLQKKNF